MVITESLESSFQLTPSRRATAWEGVRMTIGGISTHALTEGDFPCWCVYGRLEISTHALTEGDGAEE